jgi:hypothetical protein
MARACVLSLLALGCAAALAQRSPDPPVTVDESKIALHLFPSTRLDIPLSNRSGYPVHGTLLVEVLGNNSNQVVDLFTDEFDLSPGTQVRTIRWDRERLPTPTPGYLSEYRLRYTVTPRQKGEFEPIRSIVQIGPHIVDGFSIQGFPGGEFECAPDCRFLLRAFDPNSGRPWPGFKVEAFAAIQGKNVSEQTAITDQDGYASIHLDLPTGGPTSEYYLGISVDRAPFTSRYGGMIWWGQLAQMTLTTDKTLYRAGETVHLRMMLADVDKQPWRDASIAVRIADETGPGNAGASDTGADDAGKELFSQTASTSDLGVASADWEIPSTAAQGVYSIEAKVTGTPDPRKQAKSTLKLRIGQYNSPAFTVHAVPDRAYYLPGEIASLEVSAESIGGQPIKDGKVEVKSWSNQSTTDIQGELDSSGKYTAHVDLKDDFASLLSNAKDGWAESSFQDFPASVAITDAISGHTEVQDVSLRAALQPIRLHLRQAQVSGSERRLYITATYAGRAPAMVDGTVEAGVPDPKRRFACSTGGAGWIPLGSFHTNSFGIAELTLPRDWIAYAYPRREDGPYSWYARRRPLDAPNEQETKNACIRMTAADRHGRKGTQEESVFVLPETHFGIHFKTDRSLYHAGDPIHMTVQSDEGLLEAVVEVRTEDLELAAAQVVHLRNGRAELTFPYDPKFRGLLTLWTYAVRGVDDTDPVQEWTLNVVYPDGEDTSFRESFARETQRQARQNLAFVRQLVASVDDGIDESIAGITKTDLLKLDPGQPSAEGMDLVAAALLSSPESFGGWPAGYETFDHKTFDKESLAPIVSALDKIYQQDHRYPANQGQLRAELKAAGVDFDSIRDAWGNPYRALFAVRGKGQALYIVSNGADKMPGSQDDYVAKELDWGQ